MKPAKANLRIDRNREQVFPFLFAGVPASAISFRAQVRLTGATPGPPIIDLATVTNPNAQGFRVIDPANVGDLAGTEAALAGALMLGVDPAIPTALVLMRIAKATADALPSATSVGLQVGETVELAWDMIATRDGLEQPVFEGSVLVPAGVTKI